MRLAPSWIDRHRSTGPRHCHAARHRAAKLAEQADDVGVDPTLNGRALRDA